MSATLLAPRVTADDLLRLPEGKGFELVDGYLKEKGMGAESALVGTRLSARLEMFVFDHDAGNTFNPEGSYQIFADDPNRVRKPDVSFVRKGRFPDGRIPRGHIRVVPDMIAEIVSPNDIAEELETRVTQYLQAGVRLVWVVYPLTHTVYVYRPDGSAARLAGDATLTGEDVLPGFTLAISLLFANL